MDISEIFFSIQGESLHAGLPCVFVRLSGCNLRCTYCDTRYAWEPGTAMGQNDIIRKIEGFRCNLVEITGGEPLLQSETPVLIDTLIRKGYTVLLETNGSLDIRNVPFGCIKIMDVKCPSSGQQEHNRLENIQRLQPHDQIKFVISDREDYLFARKIYQDYNLTQISGNCLFSVNLACLAPSEPAAWILEDGLAVRLHLQLHKMIWPDIERGV